MCRVKFKSNGFWSLLVGNDAAASVQSQAADVLAYTNGHRGTWPRQTEESV